MQITLNQDEITAAVENYVYNQINVADGQEIAIDFTAGRGPNGISATLEIVPASTNKKASSGAAAKPKAIQSKTISDIANKAMETDKSDEEETAPADEPEAVESEAEATPDDKTEAPATKSIFSKAG